MVATLDRVHEPHGGLDRKLQAYDAVVVGPLNRKSGVPDHAKR